MIAAAPNSGLATKPADVSPPSVVETPPTHVPWVTTSFWRLGAMAALGFVAACGGEDAAGTGGGASAGAPTMSSASAGTICEGGLTACDGACVDVASDPDHCGQCGVGCVGPDHTASVCVDGHCLPGACVAGFGECDGDPSNGCETDLKSDAASCGACGVVCSMGCADGACVEAVEIAAGAAYTCALRSDGSVWCWGDNAFGNLGDGTQIARYAPVKIALDGAAQQIACGKVAEKAHTCATLTSGRVQCWGANDKGQVAAVAQPVISAPKLVAGVTHIVQVATGGRHTCALDADHKLYCWGANDEGQLGLGPNAGVKVTAPGLVQGVYKQVAAGALHTCAIELDDRVACWGSNDHGQLGIGGMGKQHSPAAVLEIEAARQLALGDAFSCALLPNMEVRCWGKGDEGQLGVGGWDDMLSPKSVVGLTTVERIAAGSSHASALILGGLPYVWGSASSGKLGDGQSMTPALSPKALGMSALGQLALGMEHSCALRDGGDVVCWGQGLSGQLGNGGVQSSYAPVAVSWP